MIVWVNLRFGIEMSSKNGLGDLPHGIETIPQTHRNKDGGVSVNILLGRQLQESKSKPGNLNAKEKPNDSCLYLKRPLLQFSTSFHLD